MRAVTTDKSGLASERADARGLAGRACIMSGLFQSIIAYTGRWTIADQMFVTKVDGASEPGWSGPTEPGTTHSMDKHLRFVRHLSNVQHFLARRSAAMSTSNGRSEIPMSNVMRDDASM